MKGREQAGRGVLGAVALGLLLTLTGCASFRRFAAGEVALTSSWESPTGLYRIEYAPEDERELTRLVRAVDAALPRLERWGTLREPLTLRVFPDHESLEAAVRQEGLGWLRAWGRYDEVFIQAPSTWGLAGASPAQLNELLLHELTHSLMYQLSADRLGWSRKRIPLWFREGMASYTAEQTYRWGSLEELARYLERHPEADPLRKPEGHYRDESNLVYGVAHHAFTFLVRRYGEEAVRGVMREMKGGAAFPEAFEAAIGLSPDAFVRDFTLYVKWRGFRGGRSLPRPPVDARPLGGPPAASGESHPP
ncbi:hypothetical protein [Cystobacter ferrugineus]|uniref:Peptidase MA-like domain-containing protein n=1 Tax=Cystobacter ferrugineus TaxID=83449 RepID=A0A1L9BCT6_9BACT|nr:hypothetical protein [Cystobacter ferrugineus]OJH40065.1 hypothetical protein BON30_13445 [Cystobacter ferrugineus]